MLLEDAWELRKVEWRVNFVDTKLQRFDQTAEATAQPSLSCNCLCSTLSYG